MSETPNPSSGESSSPAQVDRRVSSLAAGARYKAMSPARLPISREPCLTIPPGFSPSALLESPVLLNNFKVEPSPTTGTLLMASMMSKAVHSESLASPRETFVSSTNVDGSSREFEFKPHLKSSLQASVSYEIPKDEPSMQDQTQHPNILSCHSLTENKAVSSQSLGMNGFHNNVTVGMTTTELQHQDGSEKPVQELQSDQNESNPQNTNEKSAEDGYNWRKYGQKHVKGSENPRSYYKCTHPNCEVKKLLERALDGQITEVVYKGRHNHPKPQPNRRLAGGAVASCQGEERFDGLVGAEDKSLNPLSSFVNQINPVGTTDPLPGAISDDDLENGGVRASAGDDVAEDDDPESKRRKLDTPGFDATLMGKPNREPRVVVQTVSEVDILDDGYRWRKYGQKVVKGNPNPRSYYKCTNIGCPVRKHVERASHDPKSVITTYEGKHNHEVPASRTANHEMSAPPVKTVAHPINSNNMSSALNSMLRACETRVFSNQYTQAAENDTISLDLGVGISPNHSYAANQMQPAVSDQMRYHHHQMQSMSSRYNNVGMQSLPVQAVAGHSGGSSMYGTRDENEEGFSFKTAPMNHSSNLVYSSTGNLVLGP